MITLCWGAARCKRSHWMDTNRCHEGYHYSRDAAITLDCYTLRRRRSDSAHRPAVDAQGGHDGAARAFEQTTHQGSNHSIIPFNDPAEFRHLERERCRLNGVCVCRMCFVRVLCARGHCRSSDVRLRFFHRQPSALRPSFVAWRRPWRYCGPRRIKHR